MDVSKIKIGSTTYDIKDAVAREKCKNVTYSELVLLRSNAQLIPGLFYRIIDYMTTTTYSDTQSAGHQFDIIVRADSTSVLNENATAAIHEGDTYFANSDLAAWELKYCIDNDTNRFTWADSTNGKGVIYWMKDEWNNEYSYDFKNIQFKVGAKSQAGTVADVFYYTFSVALGTNDTTVTDHSLNGSSCYNNRIEKCVINLTQKLNFNVFRNTSTTAFCSYNTFGNDCSNNTFGNGCTNNTFGNYCKYNTFGNDCSNNTFGNGCTNNTFGNGCSNNTFWNYCSNNTFGNGCSYNTFGSDCQRNTFGNGCSYNTFGSDCKYNTFGSDCKYNTFGSDCKYNTFEKHYCYFIIVENDNSFITLTSTQTTSIGNKLQNIIITQGVSNAARKTISHNTVNDNFNTTYQATNSQIVNV